MMFSSGSGHGSGGGNDDDDYGLDDDYGYDDNPPMGDEPEDRPRPKSNRTRRTAESGNAAANGGRSRTASHQPEGRYWTDYLRIALPVIGIILMVGLLWLWAANLLDNDAPVGDPTPEDTVGLVSTETVDPNAVNTETNLPGTPGPAQQNTTGDTGEIPISGQPTPPANTGTDQPPATTAAGGDDQGAAEETTGEGDTTEDGDAAANTGELSDGVNVRVTEGEVNIRSSAGTSADIVRTSEQDEEGVILSGPEEADGLIWWQVVFDGPGDTGWVAEDFLEVVP